MEREEGKKLLSKENRDLYEIFKMSRRLKRVSFLELSETLQCTELEVARAEKNPAFTPCYRLIKLAEALGKNAVFETQITLHALQTKSNIRRIKEKYEKQLAEWSEINVIPIWDLSVDEVARMEGLGAGVFELGLAMEAYQKRPACVVLDFVLPERPQGGSEQVEKEGCLIEVNFKKSDAEIYDL